MSFALPTLNALLNLTAAVLLSVGYAHIRRRRVGVHHRSMLAACVSSGLFLVSYLVYHARAGSRPFTGQGAIRTVYFTILISHTLLAAAVPVLAIVTLARGLARKDDRHRAIARWTLPIWLYVSVTGVVVYWMLYQGSP